MKKLLFLSITVLLLLHAGATQIQFGDARNCLTVNSNGEWLSWVINRNQLLQASQQPFSVTDAQSGQNAKFAGKFEKAGNNLHFSGLAPELQLQLDASFIRVPDSTAITVKVNLTDLSKKDRALDLIFALQLKPGNWSFGSSWEPSGTGAVAVHNGNTYDQIEKIGPVTNSQAPWLIADNGNCGILLAHDMMKPRFFNYSLQAANDGIVTVGFRIPLGLTGETRNFPHQANLEFVLADFAGGTSLRGGVSTYYKLFPETFRSRLDGYPGGWGLWVEEVSVDIAQACGIGFNEREIADENVIKGDAATRAMWEKSDKYGLKMLPYSEPWGVYIPLPHGWNKEHSRGTVNGYHELADTAALKALVAKDHNDKANSDRFHVGLTRDDVVKIIENCAIESTPAGDWCLHAYGEKRFGCGVGDRVGSDIAMIATNANPYLPGPNRNDITWGCQYNYAIEKAAEWGVKVAGVYLDSELFYAGWSECNFRRAHWRYATLPLTYVKTDDGRVHVADHMTLSNTTFMAYNRSVADQHNFIVAGNTWQPLTQFIVPFVDMVGAGEHFDKDNFVPIAELRVFRYLSYRKLVSTMDYVLNFQNGVPITPEGVQKYMEPRINKCLMYGIFPGTANAWAMREKVELLPAVFAPYAPIFQAINNAGWEPMSQIVLSGAGADKVLRERWGDNLDTGVYFTLYNDNPEAVTIRFSLSAADFGGSRIREITELVGNVPVAFTEKNGKTQFELTLKPQRTIALRCR